ncbi:MAG: glucuronate isomerase [Clostridiales bacterium]|nr:glucuronate isomerase [Candidatus Equinaster intestinalis]
MNDNFLLNTDAAKRLYFDHAANQPIIDYHCHVPAKEIAQNRVYENLTQVWLEADHYKWRQMRVCGVEEEKITGKADDYEKFLAFASIMPSLAGNPLYTWCRLELKKYFGIDTLLSEETAPLIWEKTAEKLKNLSVKNIIESSNVYALCTTNDPTEDLSYHHEISADKTFKTGVFPAFRPDRALAIEKSDFCDYMNTLGASDVESLEEALRSRLAEFKKAGCVAADCGMPYVPNAQTSREKANAILKDRLSGKALTQLQEDEYKTYVLQLLLTIFAEENLVCELHFGVERNINSAAFEKLGADAGFDVIGRRSVDGLKELLDAQEKIGKLPKVLLYSLRPEDNAEILAICGAFAEKGIKGKVQQGSAWWFNDTRRGMQKQIADFSEFSALGAFIGMLTDSRSFLSYTRHEYFRRILCAYIGELVENDEFPDEKAAAKIVEAVCFKNAKEFFGI